MPGFRVLEQAGDEVYEYDGSLAGFYCCVHAAVYSRRMPLDIRSADDAQISLVPPSTVPTDRAKAHSVREAVRTKISERALELCEGVFLTCMEGKERALLAFLARGFAEGWRITSNLADPLIASLIKAERHMRGEAHLLTGFVRFSDHDGYLSAIIEPKNFVLPVIAEHFCDRYSGERFLIYDKTHAAALIYEGGVPRIEELEGFTLPPFSDKERLYQTLWRQFYKTIAIRERENPRVRMSHMPKRYWEHMLEVRDEL